MSNHPTPTPALTEEEIVWLETCARETLPYLANSIDALDFPQTATDVAFMVRVLPSLLAAARDRAELVEFLKTHGERAGEALLYMAHEDDGPIDVDRRAADALAKLLEKYR